jgi:(p)ppGpp synthase/HD superfamily hydrolase
MEAREMLAKAIQYATEKHVGQHRKYMDVEYIQHPLKVMHFVANDKLYGGSEVAATIAVLHDTVEDCTGNTDSERGVLYGEIDNLFGTNVMHGVHDLTNEYVKARYPNWNRKKRKQKEFERLEAVCQRSQIIKLYDRLTNLQDTLHCAEEGRGFNKMMIAESLLLVQALMTPANAYLTSQVSSLASELQEQLNA